MRGAEQAAETSAMHAADAGSAQGKKYYTYILHCADGTLYTGWTTDLKKRIAAHNSGQGAKYTRSRRPVELAFVTLSESKERAMSLEYKIKHLTREKKLKMIDAGELLPELQTDFLSGSD